MNLFVKKSIESLLVESNATDKHSLKKSLGATKLVALGFDTIIGAGFL